MTTTFAVDTRRDEVTTGHALRSYPTGVVLVAAEVSGRPVGMLADSFTSVSLDPSLVSIGFMRTSRTWAALRDVDVWGISVLPADRPDPLRALARDAGDRFAGIDLHTRTDGALTLPGSPLALVVDRHADVDAGDHVLTLLRVLDVQHDPGRTAMVLHDQRRAA